MIEKRPLFDPTELAISGKIIAREETRRRSNGVIPRFIIPKFPGQRGRYKGKKTGISLRDFLPTFKFRNLIATLGLAGLSLGACAPISQEPVLPVGGVSVAPEQAGVDFSVANPLATPEFNPTPKQGSEPWVNPEVTPLAPNPGNVATVQAPDVLIHDFTPQPTFSGDLVVTPEGQTIYAERLTDDFISELVKKYKYGEAVEEFLRKNRGDLNVVVARDNGTGQKRVIPYFDLTGLGFHEDSKKLDLMMSLIESVGTDDPLKRKIAELGIAEMALSALSYAAGVPEAGIPPGLVVGIDQHNTFPYVLSLANQGKLILPELYPGTIAAFIDLEYSDIPPRIFDVVYAVAPGPNHFRDTIKYGVRSVKLDPENLRGRFKMAVQTRFQEDRGPEIQLMLAQFADAGRVDVSPPLFIDQLTSWMEGQVASAWDGNQFTVYSITVAKHPDY